MVDERIQVIFEQFVHVLVFNFAYVTLIFIFQMINGKFKSFNVKSVDKIILFSTKKWCFTLINPFLDNVRPSYKLNPASQK